VQDGVDAERIGVRRVFLSERWNLATPGDTLSPPPPNTAFKPPDMPALIELQPRGAGSGRWSRLN
jgi:hypothetical protein